MFPNEYRRHRTAGRRWSPNRLWNDDAFLDAAIHASSDPASIIAGMDWVLNTLDVKNEKWKAAAALTLDGYTQAEIAEMLELSSERAVEGLMYRFRNHYKKGGTP